VKAATVLSESSRAEKLEMSKTRDALLDASEGTLIVF
jgi:hypothetical protein